MFSLHLTEKDIIRYCFFLGRSDYSSMVLPDGSVLVMGGITSSGKSNEVFKSTDGGRNWALLTNTAWGTSGGKYFFIV